MQQVLRPRADPKAFNRRLPANLVRCDQRPALKQKRQRICEQHILVQIQRQPTDAAHASPESCMQLGWFQPFPKATYMQKYRLAP